MNAEFATSKISGVCNGVRKVFEIGLNQHILTYQYNPIFPAREDTKHLFIFSGFAILNPDFQRIPFFIAWLLEFKEVLYLQLHTQIDHGAKIMLAIM